jgi:putative GTP pyrophosphokinase
MTEMSTNDWGTEYGARRNWYEWLTERLKDRIVTLLTEAEMDVFNVESRTKTVQSFVGKIEARKDVKFEDPVREIIDLVGVRVITYYLEDVEKVGELIQREFEVDKAVAVDKASDEPDRFGYKSVHYVVMLSPRRRDSREWPPSDVRAEIQVRTALQHAWSAVHHKLDYKSTIANPKELQRRLFRLNALFELADEQFSQARDQRERIESDYKYGVKQGQLEIPLDEASLTAYIQDSGNGDRLADLAMHSGANIGRLDSKRLARDRRDLLSVLHWSGISTVAQLDRYLKADILPTPIPEGFFGDDRRSIEDALTVLILTDKLADNETYSRIYMSDGWDDFVAGVAAWHAQKSERR